MRIVLGVSGGIAAYKAVLVLRQLTEAGHDVRVVPTAAALQFIGAPTWEALSGHPVTSELFVAVDEVAHVEIGRSAQLVLVVPATADLIARAAQGLADDLLTATLLVATCPVAMAPAMHTQMWEHPATVANVATLRNRGVAFIGPVSGRLTGVDSGLGRLTDPETIVAETLQLLQPVDDTFEYRQTADLLGRVVLISAGGTREPLDPVRFLGNRSSGKQGVALARTAVQRGATVHLVAANLEIPVPDGVQLTTVETAAQLREAMLASATEADAVVMAAAVADYRPVATESAKLKKTGDRLHLELVENPDILTELVQARAAGQQVVGFAAETGDDLHSAAEYGRLKARRKGADLLVVNDVSGGRVFGADNNEVTVVDHDGATVAVAHGSKDQVADAVWDAVVSGWSNLRPLRLKP